MIKQINRKDVLRFLPLLIIYLVIIFVFAPDEFRGDAIRYTQYAKNIAQGFYADFQDPSIRNGPGYPLVLTLPVLLEIPSIFMRILNVVFVAMALIYFYKTLSFYLKKREVLILCYVLGLYPALVRASTRVISECLTVLLVCGFLYYFLRLYKTSSNKRTNIILSGLFLGGLALTKIIFGYVILALLIASLPFLILKKNKKVKYGVLTLIFSLFVCTPYLIYTYSVTNKIYSWGTHGGEMLYWRSNPFENEYGDWISHDIILYGNDAKYCDAEALRQNHGAFLREVYTLTAMERDEVFKEKAIENMKNHPVKYLENTVASAFRLFYNYPYTYIPLKTSSYLYYIPSSFLVISIIVGLLVGLYNRRKIVFEVRFLAAFAFIFLGGIILLDGRPRHLIAIVPVIILLISHVLNQFVQIKFKERQPTNLSI
jgi:4-amino-4-deoxy-L-arabinose transferase-like glycosyltransferase